MVYAAKIIDDLLPIKLIYIKLENLSQHTVTYRVCSTDYKAYNKYEKEMNQFYVLLHHPA